MDKPRLGEECLLIFLLYSLSYNICCIFQFAVCSASTASIGCFQINGNFLLSEASCKVICLKMENIYNLYIQRSYHKCRNKALFVPGPQKHLWNICELEKCLVMWRKMSALNISVWNGKGFLFYFAFELFIPTGWPFKKRKCGQQEKKAFKYKHNYSLNCWLGLITFYIEELKVNGFTPKFHCSHQQKL